MICEPSVQGQLKRGETKLFLLCRDVGEELAFGKPSRRSHARHDGGIPDSSVFSRPWIHRILTEKMMLVVIACHYDDDALLIQSPPIRRICISIYSSGQRFVEPGHPSK